MDRERAGHGQKSPALPKVWLHPCHQQAAESGGARKPHPWCPLPNAVSSPQFGVSTLQFGVSTPQSRELAIRTLVERAATGFELSIAPSDFDYSGSTAKGPEWLQLSIIPDTAHCEVTLGTSDLLICSTLESDLSLPLSILRVQLLFSDVMWTSVPFAGAIVYAGASINDPVSPHYIVAVVPHEDEHSCCDAVEGDRNTEPVSASHGLPFQEAWLLCIGACSHSEFQDFLGELGCRGAIRWDLKKCYQLVRELNSGTFATVYLGQSIQHREGIHLEGRSLISPAGNSTAVQPATQVAVKGLKVQAQLMQSVVKSEIDLLVQCKGHPNIIQLYGIFCSSLDSGTECSETSEQSDPASRSQLCWSLVMEFFPAGDLHDSLVLSGPLTEVDSMEIFCGVMSALAHLHFHRVAHRDVKAENILLSDKGQAVLADFGSAARIDDHLAMQKNCGSPGYAAPEVVNACPYGVKADVFSSGVVLYFALSNEKPFPGPDVQTIIRQTSRCKVRFALSKFGHVAGGVLTLLRALLEKKPQLRPTSGICFEAIWQCLSAEVQCRSRAALVAYTTLVPSSAQRLQPQDQDPQEQQQVHRSQSKDSSDLGMDVTVLKSLSNVDTAASSSSKPVPPRSPRRLNKSVFNPQSCREQKSLVSRLLSTVDESRQPLWATIPKDNERPEDEENLQVQGNTDNARLVPVPPAVPPSASRYLRRFFSASLPRK
ncbi:unnamed protein product [Polarella glacialis]|uniref:Protein kinase domain-containing protein n=1 Tax=Polarella glacialis TaxID=89957 RepID=A0A813F4K2_POLGL|nr:unnamed protein product [Polarella glacialis]CAE8606073.1 unnamed protein product [Polarella glacialis]